MSLFLYAVTVIIWGTTWIAIKLQIGSVDLVVSVFYRFAIAGFIMMLGLLILRRLQPVQLKDHLWFFLQGCCLFCFNFICFYYTSQSMASGLVSIIFSLAIFFNAINNRLFWGVAPIKSIYIAGCLGVIGLVLLFWPEVKNATASAELLKGFGLGILGTAFFSLGNMITVRHKRNGINPLTSNAYGMNYGAAMLLLIVFLAGGQFTWDSRPEYVYSLVYLAIPGSVIAFTTYLSLVNRLGANQAAYATVMFPVVALAISWVYEGYIWGVTNSLGLVCVLLGNAVALNLIPIKLVNRR
ncbi:MAG: drug/metabolite transporter (DMT)-like permease [Saprospiraceae bacterium]|jgi:drug/metabolite transporter (DMT)-like permease